MFKKLTLLILMVFSLNDYAQIVIKDEISLSDISEVLENTDNSVTLTSPFYGRIYFRKYCMYNWISTVKGEVVAGGDPQLFGNYNCNCESGGYCSGCIGYTVHNFYNKPMGTEVEVNVQYCYNHQWVEVPLQFEDVGNNTYNLSGMNPISGTQWEYMGYVKFIEQTPPGCDPQFDCILNNNLPGLLLEERENGYRNIDVCSYGQPGATLPVFDDPNVNTIDINVCFNKQTQKWWFNLNNSHNFIFSYISEICPENLAAGQSLKENFTYFPQGLTCDKISDDIFCHFGYGAAGATYVLKNIIEKHEEEHVKQIDSLINKIYKPKFYEKLDNIVKQCEDFSTLEEAEQFWNKTLRELFGQLVTDLKKNYGEMKAVVGFEDATHAKIFDFIYSEWDNAMEYWDCNQ
jgi:hypothetical protein